MTLIWTRARADWAEDEPLLAGLADVVHVPCVRLVGLPPQSPAPQFSVYVIASPHTPDFFALPPGCEVHCFGQASAEAATAAGAKVTLHAVRTAAELTSKLSTLLPKMATVGVPGPETPAFDIAGALQAAGFEAQALPCYRTESEATAADGGALSSGAMRRLRESKGVVCFASPSAIEGFAKALLPAPGLRAACIGPTTAKAAATRFARVVTAQENSLASLIAAAQSHV